MAAALREDFAFRRLVAVVGMMRDKDARGILAELEPVVEEIVVTAGGSPRAMDLEDLATTAREVVGESRVHERSLLHDAIETARAWAGDVDADADRASGAGVVITGSVAMIGEARTLLGRDS